MNPKEIVLEAVNKALKETGKLPKSVMISDKIEAKLSPPVRWESGDRRAYRTRNYNYTVYLHAGVRTIDNIVEVNSVIATSVIKSGVAVGYDY